VNASRQAALPGGRLLLALVLALAAAVRLAAMLALPEVRFPDSGTYEDLARSVREEGRLEDRHENRAMVTPGYPLFVIAFRATLGSSKYAYRVPQLVLGVLTVLGVCLLGRRLWGQAGGLLAGALAALDPFAVYFESLELTEGPASCLLVWAALAAWTARRRMWAAPLAGALVALTALVRPGWLFTGIALFSLAMLLPGEDRPLQRRGWLRTLLAAAALVVVMSPWWIRNYRVFGTFVPLSTAGGQALFEGNSENATGGPAVPRTVGERTKYMKGLNDLERSAVLSRDARMWIRGNPGSFARLALVKFGRTWSPVPNEPSHRRWYHLVVSAADWAAVLLLAGAGFWLLRREDGRVWWCLAPALLVVAAHVFVVGSVRYRAPAWPLLEVLAGGGAAALLGVLRARKREGAEPSGPAPSDDSI
jgi:4-amino-4-deoxy-L-arabinose transferase-like glycosyltransferase